MRICLISTGQPSTNPRLVKEADTLAAAGHSVHVIGATRSDWADESDGSLLSSRAWTSDIIQWRKPSDGARAWSARIQHKVARSASAVAIADKWLAGALSPVAPVLTAAAEQYPADLYVAHNLGALPAAMNAATLCGARVGFDAEDFHSGQVVDQDSFEARLLRHAEAEFIPRCDYVTASSPQIAAGYARLRAGDPPSVVLNVFPMADRPAAPVHRHDPHILRLYWFSQTIGGDRGLETAVRALGRLRAYRVELHLRGELQRGFDDRLRTIATEAGLSQDRLMFHPPAPPNQMVRLAAGYDIGLALEPGHSLNNDRALSNKVFTYLLAGIPVVMSSTSAQAAIAPELGGAAATVGMDDVDGVVSAIQRWSDRDALAAARREAWNLGTDRFNWDVERKKFLTLVNAVLARAPRSMEPVR